MFLKLVNCSFYIKFFDYQFVYGYSFLQLSVEKCMIASILYFCSSKGLSCSGEKNKYEAQRILFNNKLSKKVTFLMSDWLSKSTLRELKNSLRDL